MKRILNTFVVSCLVYLVYMIACENTYETSKFFVDMENGNVYQSDENNDFLRRELYYLGSMQHEVIEPDPYFFKRID